MSSREERIAENETIFRDANERLERRWDERGIPASEHVLFICECGDTACREVIRLTRNEYSAVRDDPSTFAIVRGHEDTSTEQVVTDSVVERNDRFAVVRKRSPYRDITEATDPTG